tara:strand:- start:149 stop:331 length:183 start_codon:yes stop_codon:yes gene_type:complete
LLIESPCIGVCILFDGSCLGCHRTIEQVSDWLYYTDEERSRITKESEAKIAQTQAPNYPT